MLSIRIIRTTNSIEYLDAIALMEQYVEDIINKGSPGCLWFLEHPPTITGGTGATKSDILKIPNNIPIYETGRGGKYTYHGPGQRLVYIMLDLRLLKKDIKFFIRQLETWLTNSFQKIGLHTEVKKDRIGIWVPNSANRIESKIAAIGLRIKKWVTFHGVAINIAPDLNHFQNIVPCGIKEFGITSLKNEGLYVNTATFDYLLTNEFCKLFNAQIIE